MTNLHFIRCSDRSYQAYCPQHPREEEDDPSCFWDVVDGSLYCTVCGFQGQMELLSMSGHLTPPELFSIRLAIATITKEEAE